MNGNYSLNGFKKYVFLVISLLTLSMAHAQEQESDKEKSKDENVVHSLNDDWLVYDKRSDGFVPYIPSVHKDVSNYYLLFDASPYLRYKLKLNFNNQSGIFINNKLLFHTSKDANQLMLDIDSLVKSEGKGSMLLTVYDELKTGKVPNAEIVKKGVEKPLLEQFKDAALKILPKADSPFLHNMTVVGVAVMILLAFFGRISDLRIDRYSLGKLFDAILRGKVEQEKLTGLSVITFVVSYGLVGAFIILLLGQEASVISDKYWADEPNTFYWKFLTLFTVVLLFVLGRFVLIALLGKIYNEKQLMSIHVYSFIEVTQIFAILYLLVGGLCLFNIDAVNVNLVGIGLILSLLLKSFLVFVVVSRQISFRNKYIISYFCATEFLPTLLAVKVFI
ncbi:DUF4271 domain-containing protein [Limibacter armeniacum]|uniref:DUF4271 domain-containing protein n=1 Tax=Limibacter armeniacum TaxID=466084 RepID=UPI002FE5B461